MQQSYLNKNKENKLCFINRQYSKGKFKFQDQCYHKFGTISRVSSQTSLQCKTYLVYNKKRCQFINQSQQEKNNLRKRFGNWFLEYKSQIEYKCYLQQYIINYKDKNDDDIANIAYFFKKLLIDISQDLLLNINIINELFLIQHSCFQNTKSTNTIKLLVDNALKY